MMCFILRGTVNVEELLFGRFLFKYYTGLKPFLLQIMGKENKHFYHSKNKGVIK